MSEVVRDRNGQVLIIDIVKLDYLLYFGQKGSRCLLRTDSCLVSLAIYLEEALLVLVPKLVRSQSSLLFQVLLVFESDIPLGGYDTIIQI